MFALEVQNGSIAFYVIYLKLSKRELFFDIFWSFSGSKR